MVPEVEERLVAAVDRVESGFRIELDNGEMVSARKVVIAVGIGHFPYVPPLFDGLPPEVLTHSSAHRDLTPFKGREVCVVGGGASAIDTAALLHEAGASVQLIARQICLDQRAALRGRSLSQRVRRPHSGVGTGWRSTIFANAPLAFRALPEETRIRVAKTANGPCGGWAMKDRVLGQFPILDGYEPQLAGLERGRIRIRAVQRGGSTRDIVADHVISATGYHNDVRRLRFLSKELSARIRLAEHAPILSMHFESSVPGLYFVGAIAKNTFGPLLRFVFGARFASHQTTRHIAISPNSRSVRGWAGANARPSEPAHVSQQA